LVGIPLRSIVPHISAIVWNRISQYIGELFYNIQSNPLHCLHKNECRSPYPLSLYCMHASIRHDRWSVMEGSATLHRRNRYLPRGIHISTLLDQSFHRRSFPPDAGCNCRTPSRAELIQRSREGAYLMRPMLPLAAAECRRNGNKNETKD
jgi:hypothetical protein